MGNKSKKPSERFEGQKWTKHRGRDPESVRFGPLWAGVQPENISRDGFDIDEKTKRKVARPSLKVR